MGYQCIMDYYNGLHTCLSIIVYYNYNCLSMFKQCLSFAIIFQEPALHDVRLPEVSWKTPSKAGQAFGPFSHFGRIGGYMGGS